MELTSVKLCGLLRALKSSIGVSSYNPPHHSSTESWRDGTARDFGAFRFLCSFLGKLRMFTFFSIVTFGGTTRFRAPVWRSLNSHRKDLVLFLGVIRGGSSWLGGSFGGDDGSECSGCGSECTTGVIGKLIFSRSLLWCASTTEANKWRPSLIVRWISANVFSELF